MQTAQIVSDGMYGVLEVFGPTLEFLIPPDEAGAVYCVMMGSMPPGVSVPLHSHPDIESFFLLSGVVQVLSQSAQNFEWLDVKPGDFVHVPSGAKHAFRNIGTEPAVQLITTTPRLGRFFREVGRPIKPRGPPVAAADGRGASTFRAHGRPLPAMAGHAGGKCGHRNITFL